MQEFVFFKIRVQKKMEEVVNVVQEYLSTDWTEERVQKWCKAVKYDFENNIISNNYEGKMYFFDYEDIIPGLIQSIVNSVSDSEFKGNAEYYSSFSGAGPGCVFEYKNGELDIEEFESEEFDEHI